MLWVSETLEFRLLSQTEGLFPYTQKACVWVGVGEFSLSFKNSKEIVISVLDLFYFLNCYVQEKEKY